MTFSIICIFHSFHSAPLARNTDSHMDLNMPCMEGP